MVSIVQTIPREVDDSVRLPPVFMGRLFPRIQSWYEGFWRKKLKTTDQVQLGYRSVYVLPTRPGLMLAVTLLILLIASINYELNLGYMLTFSLTGSGLVAMVTSCATLWGVRAHLGRVNPSHVGCAVSIEVVLTNSTKKWRHGIEVGFSSSTDRTLVDLAPQSQTSVHLTWVPQRRGEHALPMLSFETLFPMGVTRAWGHWRPKAKVLIYPAPEVNPPEMPVHGRAKQDGVSSQRAGQEDFEGVRQFRDGDPLKSIAWKRSQLYLATGSGSLATKAYSSPNSSRVVLSMQDVAGLDLERGLSRLAAWVLLAYGEGAQFRLEMPSQTVDFGDGADHLKQCLSALARH